MDKPFGVNDVVCPACHRFYDSVTGLLVPSLAHIRVAEVDEKKMCKACALEMEGWHG